MLQMQDIQDFIRNEVDSHKIVLFMKGNRHMPQCGFSAQVVEILSTLEADYVEHNVLENEELRQGIKEFSNWPTIPQLYIDKEFIGGCDIVTQLYQSGELKKMLEP